MLNRELKVDVVKKQKNQTNSFSTMDEIAFETRAVFVTKLIDDSVQKIMAGVFAYVVLDTVRKVIVNATSKEK